MCADSKEGSEAWWVVTEGRGEDSVKAELGSRALTATKTQPIKKRRQPRQFSTFHL